jgi:EAL and modified HD-GYP domain-containing signal transduction protein
MRYISVIKFDVREKTYHEIDRYLTEKKHLLHGIKFLAEKVETREEFELYSQAGFVLFQGFSSADRRSSETNAFLRIRWCFPA